MKRWIISLVLILLVLPITVYLYKKTDDVTIVYFRENSSNSKILAQENRIKLFNKKVIHLFSHADNFRLNYRYVSPSNHEEYFFQDKEIVVSDDKFNPKRIETFEQFSDKNNRSFGEIIGSSQNKVWLTVEIISDKETYCQSTQIVEVLFENPKPKLQFYDIGKYTGATINVDEEEIYVFRENSDYYEVYDIKTKNYNKKVSIDNLENYYIASASFGPANNILLVRGNILGVIWGNTLYIIEEKKEAPYSLWGTDEYIYYTTNSELLRYNPSTRAKQVVLSLGMFEKFGYGYSLTYGYQDSSLLILNFPYSSFLGNSITWGRLFLDTSRGEYFFDIAE